MRRRARKFQREGTSWAGVAVWQGRTGMRISVSSWATNDKDVEQSLEVIVKHACAYAKLGSKFHLACFISSCRPYENKRHVCRETSRHPGGFRTNCALT